MLCSRKEPFGFELLSQTLQKIEFFIFWWKCKLLFLNILFFILLQLGTFLASCWPVVLCSRVLLSVPCDESYLYYSTTSQYSVIHHMFFVQSCTRRISSLSLTIQISHHELRIILLILASFEASFCSPQKCLKVPLHPHPPSYFPINQWNYFRNPHYRVVTKGSPLTTVVLYVEFIYRSSSFSSHLLWYPITPPLPNSLDTTTHRTIACITMNWKVLRFSYDCHQRWFVCVKHSLMWGSDPKTSVQTPLTGL